MTIVELKKNTHLLLTKLKNKMKHKNPVYKVNNDVVINEALTRVEKSGEYGIKHDN